MAHFHRLKISQGRPVSHDETECYDAQAGDMAFSHTFAILGYTFTKIHWFGSWVELQKHAACSIQSVV